MPGRNSLLIIVIAWAVLMLFLSSCAVGSFPRFPETIKHHYVVDIKSDVQPFGLFSFEQPIRLSQGEFSFMESIVNMDEIPPMKVLESARCLKFEIVQNIPYKIKYLSQVDLKECNLVGGYKPEDSVSLYNWFEDVVDWAEDRKHCFKK